MGVSVMSDHETTASNARRGRATIHRPFTDDGVTYCGFDGHEGCGELWPCSTVRPFPDHAFKADRSGLCAVCGWSAGTPHLIGHPDGEQTE